MNIDFYHRSIIDTINACIVEVERFFDIFWKTFKQIYKELFLISTTSNSPIQFSHLQYTILKVLLLLLLLATACIAYSWKLYGKVITEKFVRPNKCTLKEIEELKQSVAKLKLPKEHSPRI